MKTTNLNAAPNQALEIIAAHTSQRLKGKALSCLYLAIPLCWPVMFCLQLGRGSAGCTGEFNYIGACPQPLNTAEKLEFQNMIEALNEAIVDPKTVTRANMKALLKEQFKNTTAILSHYQSKFPNAPGYKTAIEIAIGNVDALEMQQALLEKTAVSYGAVLTDSRSVVSTQPSSHPGVPPSYEMSELSPSINATNPS